jgi:hypothetical protein
MVEEGTASLTTEVLLAGFGGALAVFILGAFREWWREEREREGLLRLLLAEFDHNDEVARTIGETTWDLLSSPDFPSITDRTWRNVQVRAAALLPDDLSVTLNGYYTPLQTLLTLLTFSNLSSARTNRVIREAYTEMTGKEVPANRNPWNEYLDATLQAQDRARERINSYLARPWDERLLMRVARWLERRGGRLRRDWEEMDSNYRTRSGEVRRDDEH